MKMFKCLFLLFCLIASLYAADWTGSTSEPKSTKEIEGKTFYMITSAEELAWFAAQVNSGKTTINAQLANDIYFMDDTSKTSFVNWTPIGKDNSYAFSGIFDGAECVIYGMYSTSGFAGLFGVTDKVAIVKNVKTRKTRIGGGTYAGGIVAFNWGAVSGCVNGGTVSVASGSYSPSVYSGGIVGWNAGTIGGCMNSGAISSSYGPYSNPTYSGGVAGWNTGTISGCMNSGMVSGPSGSYSTIAYSGGIVGGNAGTVSNSANNGSISYYSGGLVARNDTAAKMLNSFSVTNSAKAGVVYSNENYGGTRGIVTNCYYDSDILIGKSTVAPNLGLLTSDMQSDRFAWILNTTNDTKENSGIWSRDSVGYPIFADSIFKPIYKVFFVNGDVTIFRYSNNKGLVSFPADPEPPTGKKFSGWYSDNGVKVEKTTVFSKDQTVHAVYINASGSSDASSSSGKSSSSVASSSSSAKSSSSSAVKNSSSSSEPSDAIVPDLPSPTWNVTASGRNFLVHAAPVGKPYALFDLQGKVLAKGRVESPEMTLSAPRAGSYIVRIGNRSVRMNAR